MAFRFAPVLMLVFASAAFGQNREAVLIFKDGYVMQGNVIQKKDFIIDPNTGKSFTIPATGSLLHVDDGPRRIVFSPAMLREVIPLKPGEIGKDQVVIRRPAALSRGTNVLPSWEFDSITDWDESWQRTLKVTTPSGRVDLIQRMVVLTPYQAVVQTLKYDWTIHFMTKELGGDTVRSLLYKHFGKIAEMKEPERRYQIARFMMQAGFYEHSEKELENLGREYPESKESVQALRVATQRVRVNQFIEDADRAFKNAQYQDANERLKVYEREKFESSANDKNGVLAQDLKNRCDALAEKHKAVKDALADMNERLSTAGKIAWAPALATIGDGLNLDTTDRLDTFLTYAQQHGRETKENRKPTQTAEEVIALAVTGWLQGNSAAEADPKLAMNLWKARDFVASYLKTDDEAAREQLVQTFAKQTDLPLDVYARMIKLLPPSHPADEKKLGTEATEVKVELPDGERGSYIVQLPPDYHPNRPYPVLMLLQGREKASILIQRWQETAVRHGWILAAPLWGTGLKPTYKHTSRENQFPLDVLRDLRRKFNVDSDRVYLFGWDQGGDMAYEVALSHPGQFAAAAIMCGNPRGFAKAYAANGQYLPFYVVDGSNNGACVKHNEIQFSEWVKLHFPSVFIEYKGRANEWYPVEVANIGDWLARKKRAHPTKQLGRPSGEEFKTHRDDDKKFYWIGIEGVSDRYAVDWKSWAANSQPATIQADASLGNETAGKDARIYTQISIRSKGVSKVNVWLSPEVVDFSKPIQFRVNGATVRLPRSVQPSLATMLEEIYATGDRQFLCYAKVSFAP